jgi:multiple sugar transport system permease protein
MSVIARTAPLQARPRLRWRRHVEGWAFLAPWAVGFLVFTAGPMTYSAYLAFQSYDFLSPPKWIGLANFGKMAQDESFYTALYNTAYYAFLGVPAQLVVALLAAAALNMRVRFMAFFRTAFYLPTITPTVASSLLWLFILNYDYGMVNGVLHIFGLQPVNWLWDPKIVKLTFILMTLWQVGNQMVIFLAALQGVPEELHAAAAIDGAGAVDRFWNITVPMISPVIFLNAVIGMIGSFQVFTAAFIITDGGPADATLFYVLFLYRHAFLNFRMGYASALAWVLFLIVVTITAFQFLLSRRWVYYEGQRPL